MPASTTAPPPTKTDTAAALAPAPSPPKAAPASTPAHVDASPESDPDFAAFEKQLHEHDAKDETGFLGDKPPAEKKPSDEKKVDDKVPAPAKQPVVKDDKSPKEPKELRAQYEKVNGEAKTLRETVASLEARIAEGELKGKDVTALNDRLAAREKELEERDKVIRALKREQDPKFKEKWDAPFEAAAETARRSIERLPITNAETGETRAAQFKDFIPFYRTAVAEGGVIDFEGLKAKFGDGYQVALTHLTSLIEKNDQRERALADENKRWESELKESEAAEARQREEMTNLRNKAYKYVEDTHPEWFKANEEDAEHTELLNKGRSLVARQPKTAGEAALLQAEIFHRAAAHDLVIHKYDKMKTELESALEAARAEIAELKASGPGTTRRDGAAKAASSGDEWEDVGRELREAGASSE